MPKPPTVPLSALDLSPIPAGLAVAAEALGYRRFWLAEHHLSSGVAGAAPHVLSAVVVPPRRPLFGKAFPERFQLQAELLGRVPGDVDTFENDVQDIIDFFAGTYRGEDGATAAIHPAQGHSPEFWIHGSSAGPSARLAGKLGLPYGANYHVTPSESLAAGLRTLQRVTGADELLVTTIAHSQAHRIRSQELLADAWGLG